MGGGVDMISSFGSFPSGYSKGSFLSVMILYSVYMKKQLYFKRWPKNGRN